MDISQTPLEVFEELKALRDSFNDKINGAVQRHLRLELFKALTYISSKEDLVVDFDYWSKRLGLE